MIQVAKAVQGLGFSSEGHSDGLHSDLAGGGSGQLKTFSPAAFSISEPVLLPTEQFSKVWLPDERQRALVRKKITSCTPHLLNQELSRGGAQAT